jgi:hypothetical protein
MPGRNWQSAAYRYGFNTQEKSPELAEGHYTAEFWEYDARIGRRWNLDPVVKVHESGYAALGKNPVYLIDPDGNDWIISQETKEGRTHYNLTFRARLVNESSTEYAHDQLQDIVKRIKDGLGANVKKDVDKAFTGRDGDVRWSIDVQLEVGTEENTKDHHHLIKIVDDGDKRLGKDVNGNSNAALANAGQRDIFINNKIVDNRPANEGSGLDAKGNPSLERTAAHDVGHTGGLLHPRQHAGETNFRHIPRTAFERKPRNLMHQSVYPKVAGFSLVREQLELMYRLYDGGNKKGPLQIRN